MNETIISPDQIVFWQWGPIQLNATILFTWGVMLIMTVAARLATRRLVNGPEISRSQHLLEVLVDGMRSQLRDIATRDPQPYLSFVGTIFLFIAVCNLLMIVPGYQPPTGSLSTTTALALLVLVAVPFYGISERGAWAYLRRYLRPTPLMLPFNVIGELSRTLALSVRLFGNVMSGGKIVAVLVAIVPLIFPLVMQLLGLLTGLVQAYIFAVLAMVYIASAGRSPNSKQHSASPAPTTTSQKETIPHE